MTARTEREMLGLAAKAVNGGSWHPLTHDTPNGRPWNPLTDDGDALRLAVWLRLVVHVWDDGQSVSAAKTLPDGEDPPHDKPGVWSIAHDWESIEAAARLAIVRAAAEIGALLP